MTNSNSEFVNMMIDLAAQDPDVIECAFVAAEVLVDSSEDVDVTEEFAQTAAERLRWYGISKRNDIDSVFAAFLANKIEGRRNGEA